MKSVSLIKSTCTLLILLFIDSGMAYSELQVLDDESLSKVDAMAAGPYDTNINGGCCEADKSAGFPFSDTDMLKTADSCSGLQNCTGSQNNLFSIEYQDPARYAAPMPSCRSGGCR